MKKRELKSSNPSAGNSQKDITIAQNYYIEMVNINNLKNKLFKEKYTSNIFSRRDKSSKIVEKRPATSGNAKRPGSKKIKKSKRKDSKSHVSKSREYPMSNLIQGRNIKHKLSEIFKAADNRVKVELDKRKKLNNSKSGVFGVRKQSDPGSNLTSSNLIHSRLGGNSSMNKNLSYIQGRSDMMTNSYLSKTTAMQKRLNARKSLRSSFVKSSNKKNPKKSALVDKHVDVDLSSRYTALSKKIASSDIAKHLFKKTDSHSSFTKQVNGENNL